MSVGHRLIWEIPAHAPQPALHLDITIEEIRRHDAPVGYGLNKQERSQRRQIEHTNLKCVHGKRITWNGDPIGDATVVSIDGVQEAAKQ